MKNRALLKKGRSTFLDREREHRLAEWVKDCASKGDPRTKDELLYTASELSKNVSGKPDLFKGKSPSKFWLTGFLLRHPTVTFRKSQLVTRASANVTAEDILKYHASVKDFLISNNFDKLPPSSFGNCDETGVELNPQPRKVLAAVGSKNVYQVESAKSKESVTVTYTILASGQLLEPQVIFKDSLSCMMDIARACGGKYIFLKKVSTHGAVFFTKCNFPEN